MKQLLIISGKGGTGKTTLAGAFIHFAAAAASADCDVDAPNLHLLMDQSREPQRTEYYGMPKAMIDTEKCIACGLCHNNCRFGAIVTGQGYQIDPLACEGCGVCLALCPEGAVSLQPAVAGELALYRGEGGVFVTAQLKMGSGNTGKLVTEVKQQLLAATEPDTELAIIDGSPGIGCPVIASLSGVDLALIVTEPSLSGISDLQRIVKTAAAAHVRIAVCINKHDLDQANSQTIAAYCQQEDLPLIGRIPFDPTAVTAINQGRTLAEIDCPAATAAQEIFDHTIELLFMAEDITQI